MIGIQLKRRYVKCQDAIPIQCIGCSDEQESQILFWDCQKVSEEVGRQFWEATNRIYQNKSANATDSWINTCKKCKKKVRVPTQISILRL